MKVMILDPDEYHRELSICESKIGSPVYATHREGQACLDLLRKMHIKNIK